MSDEELKVVAALNSLERAYDELQAQRLRDAEQQQLKVKVNQMDKKERLQLLLFLQKLQQQEDGGGDDGGPVARSAASAGTSAAGGVEADEPMKAAGDTRRPVSDENRRIFKRTYGQRTGVRVLLHTCAGNSKKRASTCSEDGNSTEEDEAAAAEDADTRISRGILLDRHPNADVKKPVAAVAATATAKRGQGIKTSASAAAAKKADAKKPPLVKSGDYDWD